MGLDTTHGCWHGPYSSFMRWRRTLNEVAGYGDIDNYAGFGGDKEWPDNDPLVELLNHSDCDGEIKWQNCEAIAKRLADLAPSMSRAGYSDETQRFINGLLEAATKQEDVEFH